MKKSRHLTFIKIVDQVRVRAATTLWERAKVASRLRHGLSANSRAAYALGQLKERCVTRARELVPDEIQVTIDGDFQIGLLSVRWPGHGWLHLPADRLPDHIL